MDDEIGPAGGEPATGPGGSLPTRRSRAPRWAAIAGVCAVAVTALVAAVAVAMGDDDASAGARTALAEMTPTRAQEGEGDGDGGHQDGHRAPADGARPGHRHEPRPPYEQRYGEATADEQQAADELLASVARDPGRLCRRGRRRRRRLPGARPATGPDRALPRPDGGRGGTGARPRPAQRARLLDRPGGSACPARGVLRGAARSSGAVAGRRPRRVAQPRPRLPAFFATADEPCTDGPPHAPRVDRRPGRARDPAPRTRARSR